MYSGQRAGGMGPSGARRPAPAQSVRGTWFLLLLAVTSAHAQGEWRIGRGTHVSRVPGLPPWGWANRASDTGSFSGVKRARASVPPLPLRIPGSGCHHCSMVASVTRGTSWSAAVATREWAGRAAPHGGRPRACGAQSDWRPGWADPPPPLHDHPAATSTQRRRPDGMWLP